MTDGTIRLLDYPVRLGLSVAEHIEDWMREFALMDLSKEASSDVPVRLRAMVHQLTGRYATDLSEPDRVRAAAAARGEATVDLTYPARPEGVAVVRGWQQMLAEVDAFCRSQDLLTLARTPEQVALTDWVCDEFLRQLAGEPPRPWSGPV